MEADPHERDPEDDEWDAEDDEWDAEDEDELGVHDDEWDADDDERDADDNDDDSSDVESGAEGEPHQDSIVIPINAVAAYIANVGDELAVDFVFEKKRGSMPSEAQQKGPPLVMKPAARGPPKTVMYYARYTCSREKPPALKARKAKKDAGTPLLSARRLHTQLLTCSGLCERPVRQSAATATTGRLAPAFRSSRRVVRHSAAAPSRAPKRLGALLS